VVLVRKYKTSEEKKQAKNKKIMKNKHTHIITDRFPSWNKMKSVSVKQCSQS